MFTPADQREFDTARFVAAMKRAGFVFLSETCPIKIKPPWEIVEIPRRGAFIYVQWEEDNAQQSPGIN